MLLFSHIHIYVKIISLKSICGKDYFLVIFDKNNGFILTNIPYIRIIRNKFTDFLCFTSPSGAIHNFSVFTPPAPDKAACKLPLIEQLR